MKMIIMTLVLALLGTLEAVQPPQRPARTITVRIDVTCGSEAIEGVELCGKVVGMPFATMKHDVTGVDGRADFSFPGVTEESTVEVWLAIGVPPVGSTHAAVQARQAAVNTHCRNYTFQRKYLANITTISDNVVIPVAVRRAVKASLKLKSGGTVLSNTSLQRGGVCCASRTDADGVATVGGLSPETVNYIDAWVLDKSASAGGYGGVQVARIAVPPTPVDVNLGDVEIPVLVRNANATVIIRRTPDVIEPVVNRLNGFTLVSSDGGTILSFVVDMAEPGEDGATRFRAGDTPQLAVRIPAGTWYVAPGQFWWSAWQNRLIERCAAGEDLTSTAIPRFTAGSRGATVNVDVNAAAAERAIMGLPVPPSP